MLSLYKEKVYRESKQSNRRGVAKTVSNVNGEQFNVGLLVSVIWWLVTTTQRVSVHITFPLLLVVLWCKKSIFWNGEALLQFTTKCYAMPAKPTGWACNSFQLKLAVHGTSCPWKEERKRSAGNQYFHPLPLVFFSSSRPFFHMCVFTRIKNFWLDGFKIEKKC